MLHRAIGSSTLYLLALLAGAVDARQSPGDECHDAIEQNPSRAAEICVAGARAGDVLSQYNLGLFHLDPAGPAPDSIAGERWLRAAAHELPIAAYALGTHLIEAGRTAEGSELVRTAADRGVVDAQFDHATALLEQPQPSADTLAQAAHYYELAAAAGDIGARFNLAMLLLGGGAQSAEGPARGLAWLYTIGALPDHQRVHDLIKRYEATLSEEQVAAARALLPELQLGAPRPGGSADG